MGAVLYRENDPKIAPICSPFFLFECVAISVWHALGFVMEGQWELGYGDRVQALGELYGRTEAHFAVI